MTILASTCQSIKQRYVNLLLITPEEPNKPHKICGLFAIFHNVPHIIYKMSNTSPRDSSRMYLRRWTRNIHTKLTYDHYNFALLYFSLMTIFLNLIRNSEIVLMGLSAILLIDLILMRPYCKVSEKLRAIYFAMVYIVVSLIR